MSDIKSRPTKKKNNPGRKKIIVPYTKEKSNIFHSVFRPKVDIQIYSAVLSSWIAIDEVLADTGADISVLPKSLGVLLVGNIHNGKRYKITGLVAGATKNIYIHHLTIKLGGRKLKTKFAIAATDDVPPTLGRMDALDRLNIEYKKGKCIIISW